MGAERMEEMIARTMESLKQSQFNVRYAESAEAAKQILTEYITPGMKVGAGGSITMEQLELAELVKEQQAL